jgi:rod shape-determining protein MreC
MAVYRRESRRRPILVMVVVTSLALITLDTGGNGLIDSVRHSARDLIAPVQDVVADAFQPVENVFDGVTEVDGLRDENARLQARINELEKDLNNERAVGQQVEELKRLVDLPTIEDVTGVIAQVIGGPTGNFERTITLNKGTDKGIIVGMPVVVGSGLVGRVTDASRTRATVTLIDSVKQGVGVRTEKTRTQAVTIGRAGDKRMRLSFPENPRADISEGEMVFTSGLDGAAFPADLPVGRIVKIDRNRGELDPDIFVEPVVDLDNLLFVKALRWPPRTESTEGK